MRLLVIIFTTLYSLGIFAQNLVINPSFEIYEECPTDMTLYPQKFLIPNWYLPNKGTSDYFNKCTSIQVNVPKNFIGNMWAYNGNAYAGVVLFEVHPDDSSKGIQRDYREYLQGEFKSLLIKDKYYIVKIHYTIATYSTFAINRIGVCISTKRVKNKLTYKLLDCNDEISFCDESFHKERDIWYEVADTFLAQGGERYITIGNFYNDSETDYYKLDISEFNGPLQTNIKNNGIAYYFIDMISVKELITETPVKVQN